MLSARLTVLARLGSDMWEELQSIKLIDLLSGVTGIDGLENDPHLHGAGLHYHPRGSRLEMHLDYSIHPISKKERRLNLIVYMNRDWQEGWGGHLNLWEGTKDGMTRGPTQRIAPMFNQAVLFRTSDISWHGMPDAIECPEGRARKSVAIYYVSDPRQEATHRLKAMYQVYFFPHSFLTCKPNMLGSLSTKKMFSKLRTMDSSHYITEPEGDVLKTKDFGQFALHH